ncbi:MAG TPA: hypothetical protein VEX38_08305 [Fimbriimonadaceae bacterium]|nr:hypothetical protein [Fimbriimonadaceae bacterium]
MDQVHTRLLSLFVAAFCLPLFLILGVRCTEAVRLRTSAPAVKPSLKVISVHPLPLREEDVLADAQQYELDPDDVRRTRRAAKLFVIRPYRDFNPNLISHRTEKQDRDSAQAAYLEKGIGDGLMAFYIHVFEPDAKLYYGDLEVRVPPESPADPKIWQECPYELPG